MKSEEIECQGKRLDQVEDTGKILTAVFTVAGFYGSCALLGLLIHYILKS